MNILYESENLLVMNKPAGLVVHADGKHKEPTVVDWVEKKYPATKDVGEKMTIEHEGEDVAIARGGIVHRIDRDTSGCLLIAKNQKTFEWLKQQFQEHTIKKKYVAIVFGWIREDRGIIDKPIGRSHSDIRGWAVGSRARGVMRTAITRYVVRKRFTYQDSKYTVVDLYPQTGRTHQLRVHMAHLGHAMVADPIYAGNKKSQLPLTRTALHAEKITFKDLNGKEIEVTAPLPEDLEKIIQM